MSRIYEEFDFVFIILLLKLVALEAEDKVKNTSYQTDIYYPLLFLKLRTLSVYVPGDTLVYRTDPFEDRLLHDFSYPSKIY